MSMNEIISSRMWFYFRISWKTYFTFILGSLNTLVVTYYLAIQKVLADIDHLIIDGWIDKLKGI